MSKKIPQKSPQQVEEELPEPAATSEELEHEIARNAYLKAEARDFEPGHEMDDWLAAKNEVMGD